MKAEGCVVIELIPWGTCGFIRTEKESAAFFLDKREELFFEILIKLIRAAEAERHGELGPDNQAGPFFISQSRQFKVVFEETPCFFQRSYIPIDIRGDISLDDSCRKRSLCRTAQLQAEKTSEVNEKHEA